MSERYIEDARQEATELAAALTELDNLLSNEKVAADVPADVTPLRKNIKKMLVDLKTSIEAMSGVETADYFGTDPTFAQQRIQLMNRIEQAKIDFEFDILPVLKKTITVMAAKAKAAENPQVNAQALPEPDAGSKWTVSGVIEKAESFIANAEKSVGIATKAYAMVKALGMLAGIALP